MPLFWAFICGYAMALFLLEQGHLTFDWRSPVGRPLVCLLSAGERDEQEVLWWLRGIKSLTGSGYSVT